jgi:hypothetical protein
MYVNEKVRLAETILGMGVRGRIKEMMEGVNLSMIYLIIVRSFVNATMYPQHNNKKINIKKEKLGSCHA